MPVISMPFAKAALRAADYFDAFTDPKTPATYLTTEFGPVTFDREGAAVIIDSRLGFTIPADASNVYLIAAKLLRAQYAEHGACVLSCSFCDGHEVVVDAFASSADVSSAALMIEHARFDHSGPADVVATVTSIALRPADFGFDL